MVQQPLICDDYYVPDANSLVTEDDTPVDNFASAKQQRFLETEHQQQRADQAEQRAQLLAERLRELGIDPDTLS